MDHKEQTFKRHIRSFVKREGRMTTAQKQAIDELWQIYGIDWPCPSEDFARFFQQAQPLCLEIGFGNGQSLLQMALNHPNKNFIGIEVHRPGVGNLLKELAKQQLTNILLFSHDAIEVLEQAIPDHSLAEVYLFFPDPWPKVRHHKRRLVQSAFLQLLALKLQVGGHFYLATDWEQYAYQMLDELSASNLFENAYPAAKFAPRLADRCLTKFEQRGLKLGHSVWDLDFIKR